MVVLKLNNDELQGIRENGVLMLNGFHFDCGLTERQALTSLGVKLYMVQQKYTVVCGVVYFEHRTYGCTVPKGQ